MKKKIHTISLLFFLMFCQSVQARTVTIRPYIPSDPIFSTVTVDNTALKALTVRQDGDAGDVLKVDTTSPASTHSTPPVVLSVKANGGNVFVGSGNQITVGLLRAYVSSGTQSGRLRGIDSLISFSEGAIQSGVGGSATRAANYSLAWNSTGTAAELVGLNNTILTGGGATIAAGTITAAYANRAGIGYQSGTAAPASGTIVTGAVYKIASPKNTSAQRTITTNVGLDIDDQAATGITNSFAIRTGTGDVKFGDDVQITSDSVGSDGLITSANNLVTSTDGAPVVANTLTTETDKIYHVEAMVVASETVDHDEAASYHLAGTFKNDAGILTQIGATTVVHVAEDNAAWDANFNISGTTIQILATGAAATNINWSSSFINLNAY